MDRHLQLDCPLNARVDYTCALDQTNGVIQGCLLPLGEVLCSSKLSNECKELLSGYRWHGSRLFLVLLNESIYPGVI